MATHSGILAWRIPWTEEPGRPQSIASQSQTQLKRLSTHIVMFLALAHMHVRVCVFVHMREGGATL